MKDLPAAVGPASGRLRSSAAIETRRYGRAIGAVALPGTVLALVGPLGAGKTELAKGVAQGLGITSVVNSPTFVLMNEHAGRLRLFHADAYRLTDPEQALEAGLLDERQAEGIVVLEWADRLRGLLPEERLELRIEPDADGSDQRAIEWLALGEQHRRLAAAAFGSS